tara:strand:+ start:1310 stop:1546 length:237 start_codon:yes stop_codon:yes gene_type:complete
MDMYWAAVLNSKINMKGSFKGKKKMNPLSKKDNKGKEKEEKVEKKDNNCTKCGQNPYFCQCSNINKLIKEIDFEKDNY